MRVTAEAKLATRRRILEAARDFFSKAGFEAATTRNIAAAAKATRLPSISIPTQHLVVTDRGGLGDECTIELTQREIRSGAGSQGNSIVAEVHHSELFTGGQSPGCRREATPDGRSARRSD